MADRGDVPQDVVDELYSADPDTFMERRAALSAAAKKTGDAALAKRIAALRKPTRSAYAINQLARSSPAEVGDLVDLGAALRDAERSVDATQIRELTARRRRMVDELTRRAFDLIDDTTPSSAVRDEVVSTLTAALADPTVAAQVAAGTIVKPARWEGFGFGGTPDLTVVPTPAGEAHVEPRTVARKRLSIQERDEARRHAADAEAEQKARAKAEAERALEDARRVADEAEEAVALATVDEQSRSERLRLLEEQVAQARQAVDESRIRLRRAEIRQRRAIDALRRLGG